MENLKHTEAYAFSLKEKAYLNTIDNFGVADFNEGFIKGYMKAIEETAAPDLLEALIKLKDDLFEANYNLCLIRGANSQQAKDYSSSIESNKLAINAINKATK